MDGCTRLDYIRNQEARDTLGVYDKINMYREDWQEHLGRMLQTRLPKQIRIFRKTEETIIGGMKAEHAFCLKKKEKQKRARITGAAPS